MPQRTKIHTTALMGMKIYVSSLASKIYVCMYVCNVCMYVHVCMCENPTIIHVLCMHVYIHVCVHTCVRMFAWCCACMCTYKILWKFYGISMENSMEILLMFYGNSLEISRIFHGYHGKYMEFSRIFHGFH